MPVSPPQRCTAKGCGRFATHRGRCDDHQQTGWDEHRRTHGTNETRKRIGITDTTWARLKAATMAEHDGICHWCNQPGADQVDHIIAIGLGGARTDPANLAPIHRVPCHREKTSQELAEMRNRKRGRGNPYFTPTRKNVGPYTPARAPGNDLPSSGIRIL